MLDPNKHYLFLNWPQYLAQWYAHEQYRVKHAESDFCPEYIYRTDVPVLDLDPVETMRGSVERSIISLNLSKQPSVVDIPSDGATICIVIPSIRYKNPDIYTYLNPSSETLLMKCIRDRMRIQLWNYMQKIYCDGAYGANIEDCIKSFMDTNGIEYNETNVFALEKIYMRQRKTYKQQEYRKSNTI